ncbi:hypothetical protein GY45DRAFT_1376926 [Cubamyces sp. BRFM 1775]|nr:hypothetical protein GY45DRAFT_1376926 [Cubamyces sp. BRFM 1775]
MRQDVLKGQCLKADLYIYLRDRCTRHPTQPLTTPAAQSPRIHSSHYVQSTGSASVRTGQYGSPALHPLHVFAFRSGEQVGIRRGSCICGSVYVISPELRSYSLTHASTALREAYFPAQVDRALSFIRLVRERLAGRPAAYDQFFKALKLYEEDRVDLVDVLLQLTILCADVPVILVELNYFLPPGYSFSLSMRKRCVELNTPAGVLIQPLVA